MIPQMGQGNHPFNQTTGGAGSGTIDGSTGGSKKGFMQSFSDSQRSKPAFLEQFKHNKQDSDVSMDEEDMNDVDENQVKSAVKQ